jgi:molecular chaperone GrpE (heat shock protein)
MPSQKPRIALTVSEDVNSTLERLSKITGSPKSKIITDILSESLPVLDRMVSAFEDIQKDKENAKNLAKKFVYEALIDGNEKLGVMATEVKKL